MWRFHTSVSGDEQIGLQEYVGRLQEGRSDILYITGAGSTAATSSPFREAPYMVDPDGKFAGQHLKEFDGKQSQSATKEGLEGENERRFVFAGLKRAWDNNMNVLWRSPQTS